MEAKGSTCIENQGVGDKRQITGLHTGTMSGTYCPAQVIYKGETPACLPRFVFPENWSINTMRVTGQMRAQCYRISRRCCFLMVVDIVIFDLAKSQKQF